MGSRDPIFAFKRHFNKSDADRIVSSLVHHKVIWKAFEEELYLESLVEAASYDAILWSAPYICMYAAGLEPDVNKSLPEYREQIAALSNSATPSLEGIFNQHVALDQIAGIAGKLIEAKEASRTWEDLLISRQFTKGNQNGSLNHWGTVFSLIFFLQDDKQEFIIDLAQAENEMLSDLLAFVLGANSAIVKNKLPLAAKWMNAIPVEKFIQVMKKMEVYEDGIVHEFTDSYLSENPLDKQLQNHEKDNDSDALIRDIGLYKNYAILSRLSSTRDFSDAYSSKALELSEQLNRKLGMLKRSLENSTQKSRVSLEDLAKSIDISSLVEKRHIENGVIGKVLQAVEIKKADPESAKNLGNQIYLAVDKSTSLQQIIPSGTLEINLQPSEIVDLLVELGLVKKAARVSEKLLEYLPLNADLLRKAAALHYQYGDHHKAVTCFLKLEIAGELSREENTRLADALENMGAWTDALEVWKNINPVSLDDYQRKAICAYYSQDLSSFEDTINTARSFYQTEGLFQVLRALFELKQGRRDTAEEIIQQVIDSRKRDRHVIEFVLDFFLETRQDQKAMNFINSLSSVEQDLPEVCIKRCLVFERLADMGSCRFILEGISRNKGITNLDAVEGLIGLNFKLGQVGFAREMLDNYAHRWPLSPNMVDYQARLYIHDGNFNAAKEILDDIIKRENPAENWLMDYGLALTGCRQDSFPLGASILNDQPEAKKPANYWALMDHYPDSISLKIIAAELSEDDRLDQYRSLLADKGIQQNPEIWRVHAGMGKHYYRQGSYDLAVVSFREARKAQPKKKVIELYLINALAKMRLYDDAISIFTSQKIDEALNLDELMEINSSLKDSDRWLKTLEELSEKLAEERSPRIVLAHVYLEKGKPDKVLEILQGLDFSTIYKSEEHLICSQLLVKAGFMAEAKQVLEYLLASKVDLSDSDLLGASFLFCQMGEMHKSANLLNLVGDAGYEILTFKTDLYQKLDLLQEAQSAINAAIEAYEDQTRHFKAAASAWIQQPDFWKKVANDPKYVYLKSIEIKAITRDLHAALMDARQSVRRFPESMLMKTMAVNLANLLSDEPVVDEMLENLPDDLSSCRVTEDMCIWGEIALRKGQEILGASLTSKFLEAMPDSIRVKALQARLLKRNGNTRDAQQLMEAILDDDEKTADGFSTGLINEYQVWLAEAAMDFHKYSQAMKICEGIFEKSGITARSARTFLAGMMQQAYQNWIDQKLQVVNHSIKLDDGDKKYFADICIKAEESLKDDHIIHSMIASISVWLGLLDEEYTAVNAQYSGEMDKYASIVSRYYREGANKAEILINENEQDSQAKFILALLEMESDPEKAAGNLAEFIRENGKNPRSYTAMAKIKKNQGQLDDAYAAINLALSEWPQEYKWQLLAGGLSKQQGDLHAAMNHFRKASESHQDERTQAYLGELNLQAKNRFGIPFLEKQLTGNSQDFETLIKLGELGIRNSKYQKAAKYLENARHYKPMHPQPYILMSQVALKVGNQAKAEEIINQAMQVKPNDAAVILQKAAVIQDIDGTSSALAFIEKYANSLLSLDPEVIIRKVAYISEIEGDKQALAFLKVQKKNIRDGKLAAETARYLLKTGQLAEAEATAEQALQVNPEDPAHLELLAQIASQNGDLDKALDFLVKAIQINPFMPEFYISMAKIYQSRRDLKQAEDVLQSGLRSNPMNFDLLSSLGLLYYQQGFYKKSEGVLKQASGIDPYNQNIKRILSTLMNTNIIQAGTTDDSIIQEV